MPDPYGYAAQCLHRANLIEAEQRAALRRLQPRPTRGKRRARGPAAAPAPAVPPRRWRPIPLTARGIFA